MLTVSELEKTEYERLKIKKDFYKKVYEDLSKKITNASSLKRKNIILKIPAFLFGYPRYDVSKTTKYMMRQFEKGGFQCMCLQENQIYVTWEKPQEQRKGIEISNQEHEKELDELPSFVNLKKLANKYRHK